MCRYYVDICIQYVDVAAILGVLDFWHSRFAVEIVSLIRIGSRRETTHPDSWLMGANGHAIVLLRSIKVMMSY